MKKDFFYLILFLFLVSCSQKEKPAVSFYYWKTNFSLSTSEKETIKNNAVQKIYIRYFDIDLHPKTEEAIPLSPIHFPEKPNVNEIVPVVFIKNKVLLKENLDVEKLAKQTFDFVNLINTKNGLSCKEIQIDCDWTLSSKANYLRFMESFKRMSTKKLSATIRLHQIKYFEKTAIPNVDSGVLMYYNMGTIGVNTSNSIYDREIAQRYIKSLKKYPLTLNFALPIYSWGIHIRDNKVIGLRSKMSVLDLKKDKKFALDGDANFVVTTSNYRNGTFYKKGDQLKIEAISKNDLKEMAADLSENAATQPKEIIFYDLDEFNIKNYEKTIFEQVVSCF
ncbi:hypothetical protein [Flavobacterium seoulense]|uniref:Lipoprotein n=1 Tax=Flavobacterium seoulense TaxID=1492738 RepID=A0A066WWU5_9FLAO|nr:hypothetical protein [Flavobacterium seoulense]KDN55140.1 hypothetical protein FEM21_17310 [Flavobacterium seoulense]